ncbi:hypothetical protein CYMTET_37172 [Cymbomonas tetramitiformis]|uniref:Calcineurin-like phosphoesterase domain-containing protein n=1 Tax=Cymbomonas tetramitiformis TaxID=36881 RepID=A0AAE0F6I2_9CHLO|nr:hypothetical protein CYMTET_37172 [Cymbomonas tetramitiformis]
MTKRGSFRGELEAFIFRTITGLFGPLYRIGLELRILCIRQKIRNRGSIDISLSSQRTESSETKATNEFRVVIISDTHCHHRHAGTLPHGDLLIHCGDVLLRSHEDIGAGEALKDFNAWLGEQSHPHKIVIAGNHDHYLQEMGVSAVRRNLTNAIYLENELWTSPAGLTVYGTPYSVTNGGNSPNIAFQPQDEQAALDTVNSIPKCDILVTHGPPLGKGDDGTRGIFGCEHLERRVRSIVQPALHCYGHVHQSFGHAIEGRTTFVNASVMDILYAPTQPTVLFTLAKVDKCWVGK